VAVQQRGAASMSIAQQAWRGPVLLTEGTIRIACVEQASFKPRRIPTEITHHL